MSVNTVQDAFEDFERKSVRAPDWENSDAKDFHPKFRAAMKVALAEYFKDSFLAGSYRRKTQAVRLKDLDIIVVLEDPTGALRASASGTLELIKSGALTYPLVMSATMKRRAVECQLRGVEFWADLVPALEDGRGGLLLAYVSEEEGVDEWRPADPDGQTVACQKKNAATDGGYVPVTRICKFWNSSFVSLPSQQKPLPSYLVEAILHDALAAGGDWDDLVLAFFENTAKHLSNPQPSVPCPGASTDFVDEKLDETRRVNALAKVNDALNRARAAKAETDPEAALDAWADIFGSAFPAPKNDPTRVRKALRNSTASVVGAGVSSTSAGRQPIPARPHSVSGDEA